MNLPAQNIETYSTFCSNPNCNESFDLDKATAEIQKSGIVTAMVGLLNAQPGTRLFERLRSEQRIISSFTGDNMDGSMNFIPRMGITGG